MASVIDLQSVRKQIAKQVEPAEGTDQVDQPLIVVVNNNNEPIGNGINELNGDNNMHFSLFMI